MRNCVARPFVLIALACGPAAQAQAPPPAAGQASQDLTLLSLDELANVKVISIRKRAEP